MHTLLLHGAPIDYRSQSTHTPPRQLYTSHTASSADILRNAQNNTATLWLGDFHQAKQRLAALKKRLRTPTKPHTTPQQAFHQYRLAQSHRSRMANMLLITIEPGFQLRLSRAPEVHAALQDVYSQPNTEPFLLPLNQLLGYIGAHQWHHKGIELAGVGRIHVPFGVFSPVRNEYLTLLQQAPLPTNTHSACDVGTGSGIISIVLAQKGVPQIIATDNNPRALHCAAANFERFGFSQRIQTLQCDLFPPQHVDLLVFNPPWLPAKPTSLIETALYDPRSATLKAFLQGAAKHLTPHGQVWLILSDLAEHLGLRTRDELIHWFTQARLRVIDTTSTTPQHPKAHNHNDPLAFARTQERTFLYRLTHATDIHTGTHHGLAH